MLRLRNLGLMVVALAFTPACEKSAHEERSEAINAQREADETAREAAGERSKEVAEANQRAAQDTAEAQRSAREDSLKAVRDEIEKTSGAQKEANEQTQQAVQAAQRDRSEAHQDIEKRLDKLDERIKELGKEADKASANVAADARLKLNAAANELNSLRAEVPRLGTDSTQSVDQARDRIDKRASQIEHNLDAVDDQL